MTAKRATHREVVAILELMQQRIDAHTHAGDIGSPGSYQLAGALRGARLEIAERFTVGPVQCSYCRVRHAGNTQLHQVTTCDACTQRGLI